MNDEPHGCTHKVDPGKECEICAAYADRTEYRRSLGLPKRMAEPSEPCECLMCLAEGDNSPHRRRSIQDAQEIEALSVLVARPVAFRVRRANDDGMSLSKTEWRYFSDEAEARREADALMADYQGLYVRDGTAIVTQLEIQFAILDTLKKSAPGISETMRFAICNSIIIKLRSLKEAVA